MFRDMNDVLTDKMWDWVKNVGTDILRTSQYFLLDP